MLPGAVKYLNKHNVNSFIRNSKLSIKAIIPKDGSIEESFVLVGDFWTREGFHVELNGGFVHVVVVRRRRVVADLDGVHGHEVQRRSSRWVGRGPISVKTDFVWNIQLFTFKKFLVKNRQLKDLSLKPDLSDLLLTLLLTIVTYSS